MTPIIIDIEASGFGKGSYPVEIGLVLPEGSRHCYLVAPARNWRHWDQEAEQVHGISRDVLEAHGRPVQDVAWRLNELLKNKVVYSDAWSFDMSWLGKLFDAANMQQSFRVADIAELIDEQQRDRWGQVKQQVVEELGLRRHRASGDARILQETWRRVVQRAA
ncbi:3'-5' exonuclease [Thiosocius teredinicola]|uniref:3'-5' exonuclease n=1 Tax=Thiosocius teredinicola TaxID=1973002 RepID=UPI00099135DC